jgi:hypothetical protein
MGQFHELIIPKIELFVNPVRSPFLLKNCSIQRRAATLFDVTFAGKILNKIFPEDF